MSNRVCHFKLVLLGDTAVGKSCLVVRFVRDEFFEFQEPTIGGKKKKYNIISVLFILAVILYDTVPLLVLLFGSLHPNKKCHDIPCNETRQFSFGFGNFHGTECSIT